MRFANNSVLPLNYMNYASEMEEYLKVTKKKKKRWKNGISPSISLTYNQRFANIALDAIRSHLSCLAFCSQNFLCVVIYTFTRQFNNKFLLCQLLILLRWKVRSLNSKTQVYLLTTMRHFVLRMIIARMTLLI